MAKGRKTGGRRPGSVNKTTAAAKDALESAFTQLGGIQNLVTWGKENLTEFYRLWGKLVPRDVEMSGKDGGPLEITVRFTREKRKVTAG